MFSIQIDTTQDRGINGILISKTNISQNLWECLISIERLKHNAEENMF